jgi:integrase
MAKRWKFKAGPHGARVTVEERKLGGNVAIKAFDARLDGYRKRSLGFAVRNAEGKLQDDAVRRAKKAALELSNEILAGGHIAETVTLGGLFSLYRREGLGTVKPQHRAAVERDLEGLERFLGSGLNVEYLGPREWNALARERAAGRIDGRGNLVTEERRNSVGPRAVAHMLSTLRYACSFGTKYRTTNGGFLLQHDPTRGLKIPRENAPARPVSTTDEFNAMLAVAAQVHPYMVDLLTIAAETGRRIDAILHLQASDWKPEVGQFGALRWRAEHDKLNHESTVVVGEDVRDAITGILRDRPAVGATWLFPAQKADGPVDKTLTSRWWRKAEKLAGIEHVRGKGWHSLRRRWATLRKGHALQDVAAAGGWTSTQVLRDLYTQAEAGRVEAAVLNAG